MRTFYSVSSLKDFLKSGNHDQVGFVPTMGALHHGHLSLLERSISENDLTVLSIFVNPSQFNNKEDLDKYPRTVEADLALVSSYSDQIVVFIPEVNEIYPADFKSVVIDLGNLGTTMEGMFRPGHFQGVVDVISRFYEIINPTKAYYGEKDFQQLVIMRYLADKGGYEIEVVGCDIVRESNGLASSSRNVRLSNTDIQEALIIYNSLLEAKEMAKTRSVEEVADYIRNKFKDSTLELEYFEIVDPDTLLALKEWTPGSRACIAAFCNGVRLIDNMQLT